MWIVTSRVSHDSVALIALTFARFGAAFSPDVRVATLRKLHQLNKITACWLENLIEQETQLMSHVNLLYHIVCGTKERRRLIRPDWESDLYGVLGGIVRDSKGQLIEINGIEDHVHLLFRLGPTIAFSDFMRNLKAESSGFVRREFEPGFNWQRRYGAFSVSESAVPSVRNYIRNQKLRHQQMDFKDEYEILLRSNRIDFDERYLWN
jgi:REP element-mobilizing transposase RayT